MSEYLRQMLLPPGHVLTPLSLNEAIAQLDAITVDNLRVFHRSVVGAGDGIVSAVGEFSVPLQVSLGG